MLGTLLGPPVQIAYAVEEAVHVVEALLARTPQEPTLHTNVSALA